MFFRKVKKAKKAKVIVIQRIDIRYNGICDILNISDILDNICTSK